MHRVHHQPPHHVWGAKGGAADEQRLEVQGVHLQHAVFDARRHNLSKQTNPSSDGKLHRLLPLQVLLPSVFKIRAKSITEGENMVKMDIKNLPI